MSHIRVTADQLQRELSETARTLSIAPQLSALFTDRKMFASYDHFGDEGFRLVEHAEHKIMVGRHKSFPGYVFKKYSNDKPEEKQRLNYMRRIEGARLLRAFIAEHDFEHVVAPQKWLYELPQDFPARYLVVAEGLDLASDDEAWRNYGRISEEQTYELATVLYCFRGLNSSAANLPFTEDGRIAFIDTERWANDKDFLRKVGDRLPRDRRELAKEIYDELWSRGARPMRSTFKLVSRGAQDF